MEAMNRAMKETYLAPRPDRRLDSLLQVYCTQMEPGYWQEYVSNNLQSGIT